MRVLKAGRNRASHSLNAKYFSQTLRFQKLKIIGDWGKIQNKQLQADHNVFNPRSHIKFNSPMFIFSLYYLLAHLFIFDFFRVCNKMCIFILGRSEFFSLSIFFLKTLEIHTSCHSYIHLTFLLQMISFLSHIKRSFYNIDKLDVCSGGGSFISNVISTYFNFSFEFTLII